MKFPVASTVVVLTFFSSAFGFAGAAEAELEDEVVLTEALAGLGVPDRLGSALTVRSFPCVSINAIAK